MLLTDIELHELVDQGVITAQHSQVNGSSIDVTLHHLIRIESPNGLPDKPVDLKIKENIQTEELDLWLQNYPKLNLNGCYILRQDEFILASTNEFFNLPNDISAEYKLKSSMARNGLEHLNAGFCDPTWHGSRLTLELKNVTRYHKLLIRPDMPIGQIVFFRGAPVRDENAYKTKGQYNGQSKVTESKGIR